MSPTFRDLIIDSWMRHDEIASLFDVHPVTVQRWLKHGAPRPVTLYMEMMSGHAQKWEGFIFKPGEVITPEGIRVTATQLGSLDYQLYLHRTIGYQAGKRVAHRLNPPKISENVYVFPDPRQNVFDD